MKIRLPVSLRPTLDPASGAWVTTPAFRRLQVACLQGDARARETLRAWEMAYPEASRWLNTEAADLQRRLTAAVRAWPDSPNDAIAARMACSPQSVAAARLLVALEVA